MRGSRTVLVFVLVVLCFATASEAATKVTCNSSGRMFRFTSDLSPVNLTLMWPKSSSDCDIEVRFSDNGAVWALGIGIEDRVEQVTFGALPGVQFDVIIIKASGPNTKSYLAFGAEVQALAPGSLRQVSDLGSLEALAAEDPHYARILREVRAMQRVKAPLR